MPEIVIKYKSERTLQALTDLAKYFDFVISKPVSKKKNTIIIHGVSIIPGDNSIDITPLKEIFTGTKIEASELRKKWHRSK